jgi:hypothetical protein
MTVHKTGHDLQVPQHGFLHLRGCRRLSRGLLEGLFAIGALLNGCGRQRTLNR